ncbi:MAG: PrsW family intramembrane metalloprotease [Rhodospirillales bacterium]|nr:PrsW family intramembrane metalloprotease [Rhodospirillales bacterium]
MRFIMLFLAIAPAMVWLHYFWERGSFRVYYESLLTALAIGAVVAFPAAAVALFTMGTMNAGGDIHLQALANAFLGASIPEEIAKFCGIFICLYRGRNELRRPYDIVVIGVAVSVGFAALENMFYIGDSENWRATAFLRSLTAVPGHAFTGAIMGTLIAISRIRSGSRTFLILALCLPVILHGLYDYLVFLEQIIRSRHITALFWMAELAQLAFILVVSGEGILSLKISARILNSPLKFESAPYPDLSPLFLKKWQKADRLRYWLWFLLSLVMIAAGLLLGLYLILSAEDYGSLIFEFGETRNIPRLFLGLGLCIFLGFHGFTFFRHGRSQKRLNSKIR